MARSSVPKLTLVLALLAGALVAGLPAADASAIAQGGRHEGRLARRLLDKDDSKGKGGSDDEGGDDHGGGDDDDDGHSASVGTLTARSGCSLSVGGQAAAFASCATVGSFTLYWTVLSGSKQIQLGVSAPTGGYTAVGVPSSPGRMAGADAYVLADCSNCASGASLNSYYMASTAGVGSPQRAATNVAAAKSGNTLAAVFTVPLSSAASTLNLIFATGPAGPSGTPSRHSWTSSGAVPLSGSTGTAASVTATAQATTTTTAPTATPAPTTPPKVSSGSSSQQVAATTAPSSTPVAPAVPCSLLNATGDVSAVLKTLNASGLALPANATALATIFLPTAGAFDALSAAIVVANQTLELSDSVLAAKSYAVLLTHLLPQPRLTLEALAAGGSVQTAASQIANSTAFNVTVSKDLKTVTAALNNATILNTTDLCGTRVYTIDTVLLGAPLASLPEFSPANVSAWFAGKYNTTASNSSSSGSGSPAPAHTAAPTAAPTQAPAATPTPTAAHTPTPTTPAPAKSGYTLAEVAQHNSAASAWLAINGKVYDVTSFVPSHPGGSIILDYAGTDASSAFARNHRGGTAASRLAGYYIGDLAA